ncbi:MAG: glycosyltransferase family 9 protein [Planctomycetota bacterium]
MQALPPSAPSDSRAGAWTAFNRGCYRLATGWRQRRVRPLPAVAGGDAPAGDAILYVAWGRIGDAVLGAQALSLLRSRTRRRVVVVGRPETAAVLGPHADDFLALPAEDDTDATRAFVQATAGPWFAAVTDLHAFHGGIPRLGAWLASLPARHRLTYDGYAARQLVAPLRTWPSAVDVVPPCAKGAGAAHRHVLHDTRHYLEVVLARLGHAGAVVLSEIAPCLPAPAGAAPSDVIACQPFSNNRKKDWPTSRWRDLFAEFPHERFLLLGGPRDRARAAELAAANVVDRCGTTDLPQAIAAIAAARAFVGVDSGLAHVAAALRRPTLVVSHGSNLGYFFPYPSALGFDHVHVAADVRFSACAGCISACSREPLWRTYRLGAKCLREMPASEATAALSRMLLLDANSEKPVEATPV